MNPRSTIPAAALPGLDDCVHCGLCLPVCPTYAIDRRESENPRGRIAALRAVEESRTPLTPGLLAGLENCLVCRACESACPSGISMETLMLRHRAATRPERADLAARIERWLLTEWIPYPERLSFAVTMARVLHPVLRRWGPPDLPRRSRLRPEPLPDELPAEGVERGRVTILRGCVADRLFREEALDAGRLLSRAGYRVSWRSAGCCGALHRHAGLPDDATRLAAARARDLLVGDPDHVVVDSAGCAAALAEPLDGDPACAEVASRLTETTSLLAAAAAEGRLPSPAHPVSGPVAFFPPCHQVHGTHTEEDTRRLLDALFPDGVVTLPGEERCCGAAGFYTLRRSQRSARIGLAARERWEEAGRPPIATGNPGCLLRWESLLRGTGIAVRHPVGWARRILLVE